MPLSLEKIKGGKVVFLVFVFAVLGFVQTAEAARLSVNTVNSTSPYVIGQLFSVGVFVSTESGEAMNAVAATLNFPPDILQLVSIDKSGGIIDFWIGDQSFSNAEGKAHFEGGRYNPGFAGTNGKIISFLFKAKAKGTATITFSDATVLANDGSGTEILTGTGVSTIIVNTGPVVPAAANAAPRFDVRSSSHPDQNAWYNSGSVSLSWELPQNVTAIRTSIDRNPGTTPLNTSSKLISGTELSVEDGVWYFHIQGKDLTTWGPVTHFKIQVDTEPRDPPTFDNFPRTLTEGDVFQVSGNTYPDSEVTLYLEASSGDTAVETTRSDPRGHFQLVWVKRLRADKYNLNGVVTDLKGISSPRSPDLTIKVQAGTLQRIGWPLLNYATLLLIILAIIFAVVMWTWYLIHHFRKFKRKIRAEVRKVDSHVHARFKKLEELFVEHALMLKRVKSRRSLTTQEEKILIALDKLLQETEQEIEQEVEDIGR